VAVGQLEGGIGTGEVRTHDDDKGSVSAGPLELGNLGVGDGSRITYAIPTTAMDHEVTHAIPTTK